MHMQTWTFYVVMLTGPLNRLNDCQLLMEEQTQYSPEGKKKYETSFKIQADMKEFLTFLYLSALWVVEDVFSPVAGDKPQNCCSSVAFEPPRTERLKQNSLVLFLHRNQARTVLYNEAAFQWLRVGVLGVCVLLRACVDVSMCFQEENSSVCMVCRPCAGLWGVDCWVRNRGLLMLGLGIWLRCVSLCLHSLTVSACLTFSPSFTFSIFS